MYICNDCGRLFEEPRVIGEHHPYGMGYAAEEWYVCPFCKEGNIQEAKECSCCGEYVADLWNGLCDICYSDLEDEEG